MFLITKKFLISLIFVATAICANASDQLLKSLEPSGFVNDFANVIPIEQKRQIDNLLSDVENQCSAEIVVVTIPSLDGGNIDDFSVRLFEKWKIGKADKDNGVLILAAISDRKARIEVGYGLEGAITDARAGDILRNFIFPEFKKGDYGTGLLFGAVAVSDFVAKEYGIELTEKTPSREFHTQKRKERGNPIFNVLIFVGIIYMAIRHPHILFLMLLSGGRSNNSSGGFGGGGFGGFGGGSSGGGGASGGW